MSKTDDLYAEIVENDADDIVMRFKDYGKGAITFRRASGASGPKAYKKLKAILDQAPPKQTVGSQPSQRRTSVYVWVVEPRIRQSGRGVHAGVHAGSLAPLELTVDPTATEARTCLRGHLTTFGAEGLTA